MAYGETHPRQTKETAMTRESLLIIREALDAALLNETNESKQIEIFKAITEANSILHNM